jgi:hypothetical protein
LNAVVVLLVVLWTSSWSSAETPEHWAYRKLLRPVPPQTRNQQWSFNEIDRFVLAKLEAAGIAPSPEADRTTLIRRLSLDLTGLPPTVEEVDVFLADQTTDAYERLVERLLASPHLGEKLALDWLDLARFGDSSGYQDDGDRPNSPYRDYVIRAFNENMPFDQFTIENLAGDLLPGATLPQKVASGFNRLHRHNEEGGSDPAEFQVVYSVDRTNTKGTTWLGITLGCAQCHDHKYDPISQREYYQLYAFFNSLESEVAVSKSASPPFIRVPSLEDQRRLDRIGSEIIDAERLKRDIDSRLTTAFDAWYKEQSQPRAPSELPKVETGAAGGIIARSSHTAWYADDKLGAPLLLSQPLSALGTVAMVRSVNNIVDVGHFSTAQANGEAHIGFMAAEGPRFFACLVLPNGTRKLSQAIAGVHGVEYAWSYQYDPMGGTDDPADSDSDGEGLLAFQLKHQGKQVGAATIDLGAADRELIASFDAFGIVYRGAGTADSPLELFIDDVQYTSADEGGTRRQNFRSDPGWKGQGNGANGHSFGFNPAASTSQGVSNLSIEQILSLPREHITREHLTRLRALFAADKFPELHDVDVRLRVLRHERDTIEGSSPQALIWQEMAEPRPTRILNRGDYQLPGESVERNVPAIFPALTADAARNRLTLARWLVGGEHPLTSRVAVNRLWKQCFGVGLVRTAEDFGVRGEPPTHLELLDWLATELSGDPATDGSQLSKLDAPRWDMKRILRLIVTSATYRQSSEVSAQLRETDPENRLLSRGARFRLSAEEIRDGALTSAGLLTRTIGGRSVYPYQADHFYRDKEDDPGEWKWPLETGADLYRRGLYTFLRRTTPYPSYQTLDAPSRGECTAARSRTNTPLQALVTMNDPVFVEAARVLGERIASHVGDSADRLVFAYRSVLARRPSAHERAVLERLYHLARARYVSDKEAASEVAGLGNAPRLSEVDPVEVAAWTTIASALLNLDEALTRE